MDITSHKYVRNYVSQKLTLKFLFVKHNRIRSVPVKVLNYYVVLACIISYKLYSYWEI